MKKLSKFAAVVAAMALLMAMSTSAFADVSPSPTNVPTTGDILVNGESMDGLKLVNKGSDMTQAEVVATVERELGKALGSVNPNQVKVLANMDLSLMDDDMKIVNVAGDKVKFTMKAPAGLKDGDIVYVLHEKALGDWEVATCKVDANGNITVTLTGLSPVIIAMIEQKGGAGIGNVGFGGIYGDTANKDGKSPKTGF